MVDSIPRKLSLLIGGIVSFIFSYILSNALDSAIGPLINIIYAIPIGAVFALILDVVGVLDTVLDALRMIR